MKSRPTRSRRNYKLIGFKAYHDRDADLLAWWEHIEPGQRSDALRDLMRIALGYIELTAQPETDLSTVQADITWMRDALNDLPTYVEHVIQQVAAHGNQPNAPERSD